MAIIVPRRWAIFIGTAFVSLLFVYQLSGFQYSYQRPLPSTSYEPVPEVNDGRFRWTDRTVHYPVKNLSPLPTGKPKSLPRVQHTFEHETTSERETRLERRQHVKDAFTRCWQSYRSRAWMSDELSPISGGGRNTFGGWAATLVDALDTLWIMDLKDEFAEAVQSVPMIDFTKSTDEIVNVFETTIRYLGGFLAAYDLSGNKVLLDKAVEVGEMLLVSFDTPNNMPISRWDWKKAASGQRQEAMGGMLVSELGSLSLEFTRLSQMTGDQRWYDAIDRISRLFDSQQEKTKIPGLWPVVVDAKNEDMTQDTGFTFGGMSDSLYEYFPKEFALLGGLSPMYQKLYEKSIEAATKYLFFRPMTPTDADVLISGDARASHDGSSVVLEPRGQHLGCFAGGMLGLGGRLFSNEEHVLMGRKLTDGCIWAYKAMIRGVMPEIAHFVPCDSKESCTWSQDKYVAAVLELAGSDASNENAEDIIKNKKLPQGYTDIDDKRYILRPEAIESVFILYRITGDPFYRETAWEMFNAVISISQTEYANAAISDITQSGDDGLPPKDDRMESFWLAETLKYFFLIFSEPHVISLDEYVLNTEAHPLKRPT